MAQRDIAFVTAMFQLAGLSRGSYRIPSGVNIELAAAEPAKEIYSVRHDKFNTYFVEHDNNWSYLHDKYSGNFKSNYLARAFVAVHGYLQLVASQAIYQRFGRTIRRSILQRHL